MSETVVQACNETIAPLSVTDQWQLAAKIEGEWDEGVPADATKALARHAGFAEWDKSVVLHLLISEYDRRCRAGEKLTPNDFCQRFLTYAASLAPCLAAHQVLAPMLRASWPRPGETCAGLEIIEELGRGAFARVYLAREPECGNRLVALKLAPHGHHEAQALGRLSHPNIVAVLATKHDPSRNLSGIVMAYHGRATLCDLLELCWSGADPPRRGSTILAAIAERRASLSPQGCQVPPSYFLTAGSFIDAVLHLGRQLASALEFSHQHQILHLDLKPSNVLLTASGTPMLVDFNLAVDALAPSQNVGGTLAYMSPEQLRLALLNEDTNVDARSDIFALGVLLYQVITGRLPFTLLNPPASPQEQARHLLRQIELELSPPSCGTRVPRSTSALLRRLMAYNAHDRPRSAHEVACAFDRALSRTSRAKRAACMHPRISATAVALCVGALVCISLGLSARDPRSVQEFKEGQRFAARGDDAAAIRCFTRSLEECPKDHEVLFARGRAYQRLGEYTHALEDFNELLRDITDARALACRGFCFNQLRYHRQAIDSYLQAIELGQRSPELFNNLGYSYAQINEKREARKALDNALTLNRRLYAANYNRAVLSLQQAAESLEHISAGIADIQDAISSGPPRGEHFYVAAQLSALITLTDDRAIDMTLDYLEQAVEYGLDPHVIENDIAFAPVREHARFHRLCSRERAAMQNLYAVVRVLDPLVGN